MKRQLNQISVPYSKLSLGLLVGLGFPKVNLNGSLFGKPEDTSPSGGPKDDKPFGGHEDDKPFGRPGIQQSDFAIQ